MGNMEDVEVVDGIQPGEPAAKAQIGDTVRITGGGNKGTIGTIVGQSPDGISWILDNNNIWVYKNQVEVIARGTGEPAAEAQIGDTVRIIRGGHAGTMGTIVGESPDGKSWDLGEEFSVYKNQVEVIPEAGNLQIGAPVFVKGGRYKGGIGMIVGESLDGKSWDLGDGLLVYKNQVVRYTYHFKGQRRGGGGTFRKSTKFKK